MYLLKEPVLSEESCCSYLPDRLWRFWYFFADGVSADELQLLLDAGWRKFGYYYFMPSCCGCRLCIPLRVLVKEFIPSKNQREVLKRCRNVRVKFRPLEYSEKIFQIYATHSIERFGKMPERDEFYFNFYQTSCPAMQSEYYLGDELIAVGFLDVAKHGLSSVYFIYETKYSRLSLGTFSAIKEIEYAALQGFSYYYLGYYISECSRMRYKARFKPYELYDWETRSWKRI
ncbi:MAG: arginyltransferase [Spirochaetes bacterium]|nr:arginyltransferase [Spirochaetota bacterium]